MATLKRKIGTKAAPTTTAIARTSSRKDNTAHREMSSAKAAASRRIQAVEGD